MAFRHTLGRFSLSEPLFLCEQKCYISLTTWKRRNKSTSLSGLESSCKFDTTLPGATHQIINLSTRSVMNIAVIGGGITGLYATLMLQQEGHKVTVYEASSRLGGRIYTHHFQPLKKGEDPFFEAGAMRIPLSSFHSSVFDFIRYLNSRCGSNDEIKLLPFVLQHSNNRLVIQGRLRKCGDTGLAQELGLPPQYHNQSASDILLRVLQPWIDLLRIDPERGIQEVLRYDDMTFRYYLRTVALLPHEVIDFVETIQGQTNQYDNSFVDLVMQTLHFNTPGKFHVYFFVTYY